jgi:hypothetical protein
VTVADGKTKEILADAKLVEVQMEEKKMITIGINV